MIRYVNVGLKIWRYTDSCQTIKKLIGRTRSRRIAELDDFITAFGDDPTGTHLGSALSQQRFARELPRQPDVEGNYGVAGILSIVEKCQDSAATPTFTSHSQQALDISYRKG